MRRVVSSCFQCKKLGAVRGEQLMADLPKELLMSGNPPLTKVGVDYFGPFYVRQGRSNVKCYGCLITCLVIRAVHIEVVHSLDTNSFINALRNSSIYEDLQLQFTVTTGQTSKLEKESYVSCLASGIKNQSTSFFIRRTSHGNLIHLQPRTWVVPGSVRSDLFARS